MEGEESGQPGSWALGSVKVTGHARRSARRLRRRYMNALNADCTCALSAKLNHIGDARRRRFYRKAFSDSPKPDFIEFRNIQYYRDLWNICKMDSYSRVTIREMCKCVGGYCLIRCRLNVLVALVRPTANTSACSSLASLVGHISWFG